MMDDPGYSELGLVRVKTELNEVSDSSNQCAEAEANEATEMIEEGSKEGETQQQAIHSCGKCGKEFPYPDNLRNSMTSDRFQCGKCNSNYSDESKNDTSKSDKSFRKRKKADLKKTRSDSAAHTCHICGKKLFTKAYMARHLESHFSGKFECYKCGARFSIIKMLGEHLTMGNCNAKRRKIDVNRTEWQNESSLECPMADQHSVWDDTTPPEPFVDIEINDGDTEDFQNCEIKQEPLENDSELSNSVFDAAYEDTSLAEIPSDNNAHRESSVKTDVNYGSIRDASFEEKSFVDGRVAGGHSNFPKESSIKIEIDHDSESSHMARNNYPNIKVEVNDDDESIQGSSFEDTSVAGRNMTKKHSIDNFPEESCVTIDMNDDGDDSIPKSKSGFIEDNENDSIDPDLSFSGESSLMENGSKLYTSHQQGIYSCRQCGKVYPHLDYLRRHVKRHSNSIRYQCNYCEKSFTFEYSLTQHMELHNPERRFACLQCSYRYSRFDRLARHLKTHVETPLEVLLSHHSEAFLYKCNICGQTYEEERFLMKHLKCHDVKKIHACPFCTYRFSKLRQLEKHSKIHVVVPPKECVEKVRYECDDCGKSFLKKSEMAKHTNVHDMTRPYVCAQCGYRYSDKRPFYRHVSTHDPNKAKLSADEPKEDTKGGRAFKCNECNTYCSTEKTLERHLKIHDTSRPFMCYVCNMRFSDEYSLRRHATTHEIEKAEDCKGWRKFKCNQCNRYCSTEKTLESHVKIHDLSRPYACDMCNYRFCDQKSLRVHKITHVPKELREGSDRGRVYKCDQCERNYASEADLAKHVKIHDLSRQFSCEICSHRFPSEGTLKYHMRKTHDPTWRQKRRGLFKCVECPRSFTNEEALVRHMGIHDPNRPHVCQICGYRFSESNKLKMHMKSHDRNPSNST